MDGLITFVAKYFLLIPLIATTYLFIKLNPKARREMIVMLFCAGVLSIVLAKIAAHLHDDPRPYIRDGSVPLFAHNGDPNGFPSDHTLLASFLGFVALLYSRKVGVSLLVVAALIGWARVAAHVHHLTDIVASFIITGVSCWIVIQLLRNKKVRAKLALDKSGSD